MDAFQYEPMDWSIDLAGRDWRMEASVGVHRGRPYAGMRLARYDRFDLARTRRFQVWEETGFVTPSNPQSALIVIGNVLAGATNTMQEADLRRIADQLKPQVPGRHRMM